MNLRKLLGPLLALTALLLLASCSSDSGNEPANNDDNGNNATAVAIANFAFSPSVTTVTVGTTVRWRNADTAIHTVTSDDDGFTSSGNLSNGQTYEYTFTEVGDYPYHCAIHPAMTGTITVTEQ